MLADLELYTEVNRVIADLIKENHETYGGCLDMVVVQDDKYRNTEYETITYGLGRSNGIKTNKYYFNAINDDNNELIEKYYNEPVSYYENCGECCISYHIEVSTMDRVITVHEVGYAYKNKPVYTKIKQFKINGKNKFKSKVK